MIAFDIFDFWKSFISISYLVGNIFDLTLTSFIHTSFVLGAGQSNLNHDCDFGSIGSASILIFLVYSKLPAGCIILTLFCSQ